MTRSEHHKNVRSRASIHRSLRREILFVLIVKVLLLVGGFWFFFGPQSRPDLSSDHIYEQLSPGALPPHATRTEEDST